MNKNFSKSDEFASNESNPIRSINSLRFDNELYKQEDDVPHKVVSVKRVNLPRDGEDWEIYENKCRVLVLKGVRFSKTEKDFLKSLYGINFLLKGYKQGWKSVAQFKREISKATKG